MDIIWWIIILGLGIVIGRKSVPELLSEDDKKLQQDIRRLQEDVVYYKKLTRGLTQENQEFRRQLNESK